MKNIIFLQKHPSLFLDHYSMECNNKKKYKMKIQLLPSANPGNKAQAAVRRKFTETKNQQLCEAVEYCITNGVRGQAALSTGQFNLIKDRETINRRLDGKVKTGQERGYCSIFTVEEEDSVVKYVKNMNRACRGLNRAKVSKLLLDILRIKDHANKKLKGGRKYAKLTPNARKALEDNKLSRSFWRRFDAKHPSLTTKRQGHVSVNRALSCTREMACEHLDDLAEELIAAGIMTNEEQVESGVYKGDIDLTRVFNCDETPQFVSYGVDGTSAGLVYAAKGDSCQKMMKENRECVTIHPFVSFSGEVVMCQVIFASVGITSQMAPPLAKEKIKHLLISTTEHGVSDQESFLAASVEFDEYLSEYEILRPVVLIADGHSSRFDYNVLIFLFSRQIWLFIGPAFSTSVTQLLDQLNKNLHTQYRKCKDSLFNALQSINREAFMTILAEIWSLWATRESLQASAKRVGITDKSLDVNHMQQDKFATAASLIQGEEAPSTPDPLKIISPNKRKGSAEYYKAKFEQAQSMIKDLSERFINLEEIPDLLTVKKVKPNLEKTSVRVTQVHGSMRVQDIITKVKQIKDDKQKKADAKDQAIKNKEELTERFIRCKEKCSCEQSKCAATGLKQCLVCKNILKSQCGKAKCKVDGVKPTMILPAGKKDCQTGRRKKLFETDEEEDDEEDKEDEESEDATDDDEGDETEEDDEECETDVEMGEGSGGEDLKKIPLISVKDGDWVKVKYEEEIFIGKVIPGEKDVGKQIKKHVRVRCLVHPYGIRKPQDMERENDAVDYIEVYECTDEPRLIKVDRSFKWIY